MRGAAAEALGRFGVEGAVTALKPLLDDPSAHVRVQAAAALYRLNDTSGTRVFQQVLQDEKINAAGRLIVAEAMASRPDETWRSLVRDLATAEAPEIRLSAARLAASFDQDLARTVLRALTSETNPAIREEASRALAGEVAGDLTALRGFLRSADPLTQVVAADTILALTR
jgi:HEAT repeat protein